MKIYNRIYRFNKEIHCSHLGLKCAEVRNLLSLIVFPQSHFCTFTELSREPLKIGQTFCGPLHPKLKEIHILRRPQPSICYRLSEIAFREKDKSLIVIVHTLSSATNASQIYQFCWSREFRDLKKLNTFFHR